MGKPPLAHQQAFQQIGSAREKVNDVNSLTAGTTDFIEAEKLQVHLKKQQSAVTTNNNAFSYNKLMQGGASSTKNAVFERKNTEGYKSSSRVAHHHGARGTPTQVNLNGIVPNQT